MATAKTERLLDILTKESSKYKTVVVVSFRKTFSDEFAEKMNFANYQEVRHGSIRLHESPRLIIQFESLHRLDIEDVNIDLVVFDEIESILN